MIKRLLVISFGIFLFFGCAKKEIPQEVATGGGSPSDVALPAAQDSNIQSQNMTFDPQGSDSGTIDGLFTIHFEYNKANLSEKARGLVAKNVQWLKAHSDVHVQIEGHCDRHGSIEYNLALGERRAKAVKGYIVTLGVKADRLSVISYGKEKNIDAGENESADGKNRRANFVVQEK